MGTQDSANSGALARRWAKHCPQLADAGSSALLRPTLGKIKRQSAEAGHAQKKNNMCNNNKNSAPRSNMKLTYAQRGEGVAPDIG